MSTYFEEMYEYLVKPENYNAAKEIANLLSSIEQKLISDFWKEVKEKLSDDIDFGWEAKLDEEEDSFNYYLHKPHWKDVEIGFETDYYSIFDYGIWFDRKKFDPSKIIEISEKHKDKLTTLYPDNQSWLCYNPIPNIDDYKFNGSKEKILRILPSSRESKVLEISSLLKNYAKNVEKICDEINTYCRKNNINP